MNDIPDAPWIRNPQKYEQESYYDEDGDEDE